MCDPYMYKGGQPDRTHTSKELHERYAHLENGEVCNEAAVSIAGRILARRAFGKLLFMTAREDSWTIQVGRYDPHITHMRRLCPTGCGVRGVGVVLPPAGYACVGVWRGCVMCAGQMCTRDGLVCWSIKTT